MCSLVQVDFKRFCDAVFWLAADFRLNIPGLPKTIAQAYKLAERCSSSRIHTGIVDVLETTRNCRCSDPRDKVYATLSLCYKEDRITPDYTKPVQKVFHETLLQQVEDRRSLEVLSLCDTQHGAQPLQSWMKWSLPSTVGRISLANTAHRGAAQASVEGESVLIVMGAYITTVSQLNLAKSVEQTLKDHSPNLIDGAASSCAESIGKLTVEVFGKDKLGGLDTLLRSLCRTMCCGEFDENYLPSSGDFASLQTSVEYIEKCRRWHPIFTLYSSQVQER